MWFSIALFIDFKSGTSNSSAPHLHLIIRRLFLFFWFFLISGPTALILSDKFVKSIASLVELLRKENLGFGFSLIGSLKVIDLGLKGDQTLGVRKIFAVLGLRRTKIFLIY